MENVDSELLLCTDRNTERRAEKAQTAETEGEEARRRGDGAAEEKCKVWSYRALLPQRRVINQHLLKCCNKQVIPKTAGLTRAEETGRRYNEDMIELKREAPPTLCSSVKETPDFARPCSKRYKVTRPLNAHLSRESVGPGRRGAVAGAVLRKASGLSCRMRWSALWSAVNNAVPG
ncbi:hypothetical protein MHYP_G00195000 [Metynnis hypsauchen]